MNDQRTPEQISTIADALIELGYGSLILAGIDPQSLLKLIREDCPDDRTISVEV